MSRRVIGAVGELRLVQQGLPDLLQEEEVADQVAARGREDHLALLGRPVFEGAVQIDRLEVTTQRLQERRASLDPSILAVLRGSDRASPADGSLHVETPALEIDGRSHERGGLAPPEPRQQAGQDERRPSRIDRCGRLDESQASFCVVVDIALLRGEALGTGSYSGCRIPETGGTA